MRTFTETCFCEVPILSSLMKFPSPSLHPDVFSSISYELILFASHENQTPSYLQCYRELWEVDEQDEHIAA